MWSSLKFKFNSLELDSEVGVLVATLVGVAMPLECDREGCEVGAWCMLYAVLSVCLSRTGFHGHSHSIPGHLWRRVTAGSRSQGRRETRRFTAPQEAGLTPRMSRKCPKCPSPVAARSGFRLRQDLQCSIIWWLPGRGTIYVVHA